MNALRLTFYGDDFTGSTDVMEALTLGGVPTVLFLAPPTPEFVAERFPQVQALGVAGVSRSMSPAQMSAELPPIFTALAAFRAPLFHYKICSTFDSSPTVGSIGHAIELGVQAFGAGVVPLMVGAPVLKRYVAFGNLFATIGDETYRLDRHPTMRQHPITPMDEADLRLHLGKQTTRRIGLIDMRHLATPETLAARWAHLSAEGCQIVLFDTLDERHLQAIGGWLWAQRGDLPVFVVGSSGVEYALTSHWQQSGNVGATHAVRHVDPVPQTLVISGSAAPQTAAQIEWALANGFHGIRLDGPALVNPATADAAREAALAQALAVLEQGGSPLLYSALGPTDPAIPATRDAMIALGMDPQTVGERLGSQQGRLLRDVLGRFALRRVCVSGGDTCGHAARQLGIYALEYVMPIAPGSPLCRARSHQAAFDGLEISLKAGQVGRPDYFGTLLSGRVPA
jgi:uncharacterized protein YgbK (DUF1537 family)